MNNSSSNEDSLEEDGSYDEDRKNITQISVNTGGGGLASFFNNPFKDTLYDKKELLKEWHKYNENMYFSVSISLSIS